MRNQAKIGDRFGKLVVCKDGWVEERNGKREQVCLFNCDCGTKEVKKVVRDIRSKVKRGRQVGCKPGCVVREKLLRPVRVGERFGKLIVVKEGYSGIKNGTLTQLCLVDCECGVKEKEVAVREIRSREKRGRRQGCGPGCALKGIVREQAKVGERFGKLKVVKDGWMEGRGDREVQVCIVDCDCGTKNKKVLVGEKRHGSRKGRQVGCGCEKKNVGKPRRNIIRKGEKFERLTAIEDGCWEATPSGNLKQYVLCKCSCGKTAPRKYMGHSLQYRKTLSCGCLNKERTEEAKRKPIQAGEVFKGDVTSVVTLEEGFYTDDWKQKVLVQCSCGSKPWLASVADLRGLKITSCGCAAGVKSRKPARKGKVWKFEDSGTSVKALTPGYYRDGKQFVLGRCGCGKKQEFIVPNLDKGNTKSCGCLHSERTSKANVERMEDNTNLRSRWMYEGPMGVVAMRSSWEVALAHWYDGEGISWLYEPKVFTLAKGCRYIPDFYLPQTNEWVEVKGSFYDSPRFRSKKKLFTDKGYVLSIFGEDELREIGFTEYSVMKTYKNFRVGV